MKIEDQLKLSREEQLALEPTVKVETRYGPMLHGDPPLDDPRIYHWTDAEALAWNEANTPQ